MDITVVLSLVTVMLKKQTRTAAVMTAPTTIFRTSVVLIRLTAACPAARSVALEAAFCWNAASRTAPYAYIQCAAAVTQRFTSEDSSVPAAETRV